MAVAARRPRYGPALHLFTLSKSDQRLREVGETFASLLGVTRAELVGRRLSEIIHPDDLATVEAARVDRDQSDEEVRMSCRFVRSVGHPVFLQWVQRSEAPGVWRAESTTAELADLVSEQRDLRTRLDLAVGRATTAMWDLELPSGRLRWEAQAASMLSVVPEPAPATVDALTAVIDPRDAGPVRAAFAELADHDVAEVGLRVAEPNTERHLSLRGRVLERDPGGRAIRAVGLLVDVTTERAMEEQLLRMTMTDAHTGAPNRRAFSQALRGEWRRCNRSREPLSILMVDVDRFKQFNDTFGHPVGDQALVAVFRALQKQLLREGDLVARYGGEEFSVVLPGADVVAAGLVGQRLVDAVRATTIRQASDWPLSVSVGAATWLPDRELLKADELVERADQALYEAKAAGRNRTIAYEESLAARDLLQTALAEGIHAGEFELHYQPIVNLSDDHVTQLEALVRWQRPGHGLVPPGLFIPAIESTPLICDLGRWVLREAAEQLAEWSAAGLHPDGSLRVAVNISARHAAEDGFPDDVETAIHSAGIRPSQLELELTETALRPSETGDSGLARARLLGITVAVDDFGTGFTSIGELARLPADKLKIDRSFVASDDPRNVSLVRLMIETAHVLGLTVVAEGVEEPATLQQLRSLGCDAAQGYLMARPMPAREVGNWLADWHARLVVAGAR